MASSFDRFRIAALAALLGAGAIGGVSAPAAALPGQCASNHNVGYVHRRLAGVIGQLQHDRHDYGGHRVKAIQHFALARQELIAAEQYAVQRYHDNPRCFRTNARSGAPGIHFGIRPQGGSNADIWGVRRWSQDLFDQLNGDDRDYGGHKAAAMRQIQAGRDEMFAAEDFAADHGY